jgi:hypothetical protein
MSLSMPLPFRMRLGKYKAFLVSLKTSRTVGAWMSTSSAPESLKCVSRRSFSLAPAIHDKRSSRTALSSLCFEFVTVVRVRAPARVFLAL